MFMLITCQFPFQYPVPKPASFHQPLSSTAVCSNPSSSRQKSAQFHVRMRNNFLNNFIQHTRYRWRNARLQLNSIANAMDLLQSCTKPSIYRHVNKMNPRYFSLTATALKPQQIPMFLYISAWVWGHRWSPHKLEQKGSMLKLQSFVN